MGRVMLRLISRPSILFIASFSFIVSASEPRQSKVIPQLSDALLDSYDRLLPLDGGSNFRDLGGYSTIDGHQVRRGLLFRSGSMGSLTDHDMEYLDAFGFNTVVDLRSREEIELIPNLWAVNSGIDYDAIDYSLSALIESQPLRTESGRLDTEEMLSNMGMLYRDLAQRIKPQLRVLFQHLLRGNVPIVVNCSAGQDRTGVATALLLTALGVPRALILDDYLLSTRFRKLENERSIFSINELENYAETNFYAEILLSSLKEDAMQEANSLYTKRRVPYLQFAFNSIEETYGSVMNYLDAELNIGKQEIEYLRETYLQ